jgi:hypothetical protein
MWRNRIAVSPVCIVMQLTCNRGVVKRRDVSGTIAFALAGYLWVDFDLHGAG